MNSTTFPLFRRAKSEPKLVVKFFDENRGEVIKSPIKSRDSMKKLTNWIDKLLTTAAIIVIVL